MRAGRFRVIRVWLVFLARSKALQKFEHATLKLKRISNITFIQRKSLI